MDHEADSYRLARETVVPKLLKLMRGGRVRSILLERHGTDLRVEVDQLGRKSVADWIAVLESKPQAVPE